MARHRIVCLRTGDFSTPPMAPCAGCDSASCKDATTMRMGHAMKRVTIMARDGWRCLCCGSTRNLTLDHIVPSIMGGISSHWNLQTLCKRCNRVKDAEPCDFRAFPHWTGWVSVWVGCMREREKLLVNARNKAKQKAGMAQRMPSTLLSSTGDGMEPL